MNQSTHRAYHTEELSGLTQISQISRKASRYALAGHPDGNIRAIAMYAL